MAIRGGPDINERGLTMYLDATNSRSYPGSGTSWGDLTGNGNTVTLVNGPAFSATNNGNITFDGIDDNGTASTIGTMGTGNWTLGYWWKSNGSQPNYTAAMSQGFTFTPTPVNGAWASKVAHTSGNVNFTYYNNGIVDNLSSTNPNDGIWHHLVTVRNGTSVIVYMDTVSVLSLTLPAGYSFGTGATVYVGLNPRDSAYLKGGLGQIFMYNVALTTNDIIQSFNAQRSRFGI